MGQPAGSHNGLGRCQHLAVGSVWQRACRKRQSATTVSESGKDASQVDGKEGRAPGEPHAGNSDAGDGRSVPNEGKPSQGVCVAGTPGRMGRGSHFGESERVTGREQTRRTPGSDAGCNKPAGPAVEQTVEVVRAHEDGTCSTDGSVLPKEVRLGVVPGVDTTGRDDGGDTRGARVATGLRTSHERTPSQAQERSVSSGDETERATTETSEASTSPWRAWSHQISIRLAASR